jgi:hypothetical protein
VPAGSLAKAALVGANTVKGPALLSVPTRSAATTAATKVLWSADPMAISAMSFPWLNTLADSNKEKNRMDNFFIFLSFYFNFYSELTPLLPLLFKK